MKTRRFQLIEDLVKGIMEMETPGVMEVDNGIGAYEYWGSKGVDTQLDGEVEEMDDVKLELFVPRGYTTLTSANFSDFIAGNILEVAEAVYELEAAAKKKYLATINDEDTKHKTDYSDIIKLSFITQVETYPCSTDIYKLIFIFTWCDAREM